MPRSLIAFIFSFCDMLLMQGCYIAYYLVRFECLEIFYFGYDWCFVLSLFEQKFEYIIYKYQSYPMSRKADEFEQKNM